MGIYWAAVDNNQKQYFEPPGSFANKTPGLYHPHSPFPAMVVMMNSRGNRFEIDNDMGASYETWSCYENITDKVYAELLTQFPNAKKFYEADWEEFE